MCCAKCRQRHESGQVQHVAFARIFRLNYSGVLGLLLLHYDSLVWLNFMFSLKY